MVDYISCHNRYDKHIDHGNLGSGMVVFVYHDLLLILPSFESLVCFYKMYQLNKNIPELYFFNMQ